MKAILLVMLFISTIFASGLNWSNDYKAAVKSAKEQKKDIYVFITSDYCKWCREFENVTLKDKWIMKTLNENYVLVHLSKERDVIPKGFATSPIPRHFFVSSSGEILFEDLGYRTVSYFYNVLNELKEEGE